VSDNTKFVSMLLKKMEEAKPGPITADRVLTPDFIQKHTPFQDFAEMVKAAIKESGLLEEYSKKLKDSLV